MSFTYRARNTLINGTMATLGALAPPSVEFELIDAPEGLVVEVADHVPGQQYRVAMRTGTADLWEWVYRMDSSSFLIPGQAGGELYGVSGPVGDVEIVGLAAAALARVGAGQSRIDLGHVAFTKLVLEEIADDRRQELAHLLARKDRAGLLAISRSLPARMRKLVIELGELYGPADEVVKRARRLSLPRPLALALRELEEVLRRAQRKLPGNQYRGISVDLGEVRGRGYYTGLRIAGYVGGAGGAVVRGGRYDELVSRYGTPVPAVGMAIDVDMLAEALAKEGIVR